MTDATGADMRRMHRGAAVRLAAELIGRGLQLLLVYAAQRILGPALFGQFTFAVAVGLLVSVATDCGTPLIVTREIARQPLDGARIAGAGLTLKLALSLPAIGIVVLTALTRPPEIRIAAIALGLAMLATSFVELLGYILRGLHRIHQETALLFALRLLTLVFGGWTLWAGNGLAGLAAAYLMAAATVLIGGVLWLVYRFFSPLLRLDAFAREVIVRSAAPLGGATLLSIAFTRTPIFVLDVLHGPAIVGVYGVAQRLIEPLAIVPAALMAAMFPALSRIGSDPSARRVLGHGLKLLAAAGGSVALIGVVFGPRLVDVLYADQYPGAGFVLQVLAAAALPVFLNYALTHVLIARDRPDLNLIFNGVIFGLNLVLCWALASRFGTAGAAAAVFVSEVVLFGLCWVALRQISGSAGGTRLQAAL